MVSAFRAPIMVLCVAVVATPAFSQAIPNWPAPATWTSEVRAASGSFARATATTLTTYPALPFIALTPCRVADTRGNGFVGQYGPPSLAADATRSFTIAGQCGIPASAAAVSFNFGALNVSGAGDLRIFPAGEAAPLVSTLNYDASTPNIANAAVVPLGTAGAISVQADAVSIDLIIDVNGYYGSRSEDLSNVFLGPGAGNTTMAGSGNTGIGDDVLASNTDGHFNTATGNDALANNDIGSFNTAAGFAALLKNNSGSGNAAFGVSALFNNTNGFENIAVGHAAGLNLTTGDFNIDIGNPGVAGESETIRIGTDGTHTRAFLAGVRGVTTGVNDAVAVMIDSAGQLGTLSSSRRFKRDIEDMGDASDALMKLRPVTFRYRASPDPSGPPQYGLIAEEVADVLPDLVIFDGGGQPETVRYHLLVPMLLNEVQKDRKTIADLTARLERLEVLMRGMAR